MSGPAKCFAERTKPTGSLPNAAPVYVHVHVHVHAVARWQHARTGDCVALGGRRTDHLEEVLSDTKVILLLSILADDGVNDCLEDILFWHDALHIFNEVVCLSGLIVLQVIYDQVKACLRDNIDEWWQNLESIFSSTENY